VVDVSQSLPEGLEDVVKDLVEEKVEEATADLREENEQLRDRVAELEDEVEDLRDDYETEKSRNERVRASVSRIINTLREYEDDETIGPDDPQMVPEAANVGERLFDTIQRTEENEELIDFSQTARDGGTRSVTDKYLDVLEFAKDHAETEDVAVVRLTYKQVAREYGCAVNTNAYRVMQQMEKRISGVLYRSSRDLSWDVQGVGGKHIEIQLSSPGLRGWIRAQR
jgi:dsDNA-specific endonuclease/ATPase MutS2